MRAGIYLRISQDRTGEAAGVNRQREDCTALADQLGWQIVEVYEDNDTGAYSGKPREHYQRMLADIEAGRLDGIIVWHPDRLYRRLRDLEELADVCERHRIMVRAVRAGEFDLSTPTGRMLAGILASVAKGEVEAKADRWKRSYMQRRKAGQFWGAGPRRYGYTPTGEIIDAEAAVVREVAERILAGESLYSICGRLQAAGIRTTRGNYYRTTTLRDTMRRPYLAGLVVYKDEILGDGAWEPILDRQTWETVQAVLNTTGRPPGRGRPALLSGLAFCGHADCGRRLYVSSHQRGKRYVCQTEGQRRTRHVAILARQVEDMVESYAREMLADDGIREAVEQRLTPAVPAQMLREIAGLETELEELRESLSATRRDATRADVVRAMDRIRDDIDARRALIGPVSARPAIPAPGDWPETVDRRSELIRLVVRRVVVLPTAKRGGRFDPDRVRIDPA